MLTIFLGGLGSLAMFIIMLFMQRFLFFEFNTEKQKRITCVIMALSYFILFLYMVFLALNISGIDKLMKVLTVLAGYVAIIYSSITGRRSSKWLGIFVVIPLTGYFNAVTDVISIPLTLNTTMSPLYQNLYTCLALYGLVLLIFVLNKKKPRFIRFLESDIEHRKLSVAEEFGIWAVGTYLFVLNAIVFDIVFKDVSDAAHMYNSITNTIIATIIILLILNNNYRKYYYGQNLALQKSLITTMADLVENRDENTGGHIQRTAKYVEIIAKKLHSHNKYTDILTDSYIDDMVVAAPLHDVGKIHIPDAVLNKPGKLTDNEFRIMKTHAAAGGNIIDKVEESVGDIEYLRIAKEMAEYHHERMDGKGYPYGLRGQDIPLCARILAVADVFDALVSKRCYKDPMPLEIAFSIIEEEKGSHFDIDVANAFIECREEIETYLDEVNK